MAFLKYLVLTDTRNPSLADTYTNDHNFHPWLKSFDDINEALKFVRQLPHEASVEIYVSKENLLVIIPGSNGNGAPYSLVRILDALPSIAHITAYHAGTNCELDPQMMHGVSRRLFKPSCSDLALPIRICNDGISHLQGQIAFHKEKNESHLIANIELMVEALWSNVGEMLQQQRPILQQWQDNHSNKPGVPPS